MTTPSRAALTRRQSLAAVGLPALALATACPRAFAQGTPSPMRAATLSLLYRTDPARIARVLPPPLLPDDDPIVQIDFFVSGTPGGTRASVMAPSEYFETGLHVAARYGANRGRLQLSVGLNQEWGRSQGREGPGWQKKDGIVSLDWTGDSVTAGYSRRGLAITRLAARITDKPAHPRLWMREFGWGSFLFRQRLDPDWRRGLVDRDYGVELWRLGGNDQGFPTEEIADEPGVPRALDPASIDLLFPDASVQDPWAEFPVIEMIGGAFAARFGQQLRRPPRQGSSQQTLYGARAVFLETVDPAAFEPFALFNYDRPVNMGKPWTPSGWPARATGFKLAPAEITRYRNRPEIAADARAIDLQWTIAAAIHRRTLPPPLAAGPDPQVRLLALDIARSDVSPVAYRELWLMVRCEHQGQLAWYPLSHIVGAGGDVLIGRETWGYPSRLGDIAITAEPQRAAFSGHRLLRDFVNFSAAAGSARPASTENLDVICIAARFNRPGTDTPFAARLVRQPWRIDRRNARGLIDPKLGLPAAPAPGIIGLPDPWFELAPDGALTGAITGSVADVRVARGIGARLGPIDDHMRYYLERLDGTRSAATEPSRSTFLVIA